MSIPSLERLRAVPGLRAIENEPLCEHTRFGLGGAAELYVEAASEEAFIAALRIVRDAGTPWVVIGSGSNLVVADEGFRGTALRFTGASMRVDGECMEAEAGAVLQEVVDLSIAHGLARIHTMTGIPGTLGAAVYGNAGAYGHSISESVETVRYFDGDAIRAASNAECAFVYRGSVFKHDKNRIILSTRLKLERGDAGELAGQAGDILRTRNEKYPPAMKCAGSIFKNIIVAQLPEAARSRVPARIVREGKAPSAWFLEQAGAKGLRNGGIEVAGYHANLIYNAGGGTSRQLREVVRDLKARVRVEFGFDLEEEVQYVGFNED